MVVIFRVWRGGRDVLQNVSTKTADFTKSRENMETEPTPAEQAKKLVNDLAALEDYMAMDEYLAKNGENISKEVLKLALVEAEKQKKHAGNQVNYQRSEETHYENVVKGDSAYQDALDNATKLKEQYKNEITILNRAITHLQKLLNLKSIPTDAEKIGVTNMDETFAKILANPKFAGTIKNNEELNDLVFAGFSPEFQKRFNELRLKVLVKKYPTKLKIYFVCGTDKNGEIYDVQMGDSRWVNQKYFILKDEKYGEVLAQTDDGGMIQQIREISPEQLEKRVIEEDGSIIPSGTIIITKNSNPHSNKIANN